MAATGGPLPWPAPEALALKFVAHHLFDPDKRAADAAHGMPAEVEDILRAKGHLRSFGPHAPATVKRRLAHWGTLHRWRGLDGPFAAPKPFGVRKHDRKTMSRRSDSLKNPKAKRVRPRSCGSRARLRVARRPPFTRAIAAIMPSGADMPAPWRAAEPMISP